MGKARLEDMKFTEAQFKEIIANATDDEARNGPLMTYDELMTSAVEAEIDPEYVRQSAERFSQGQIVKVKRTKEGKLERKFGKLPASLRWTSVVGKSTSILAGLGYAGAGIVEIINPDLIGFEEVLQGIVNAHISSVGFTYILGTVKDFYDEKLR